MTLVTVKGNPKEIIGDMAYDNDPLDKQLRKRKMEFIAPHTEQTLKRNPTQDGKNSEDIADIGKSNDFLPGIQNFRKCVARYVSSFTTLLGVKG